jgi:hypothetical protein
MTPQAPGTNDKSLSDEVQSDVENRSMKLHGEIPPDP